jgi:hypothetical protein
VGKPAVAPGERLSHLGDRTKGFCAEIWVPCEERTLAAEVWSMVRIDEANLAAEHEFGAVG